MGNNALGGFAGGGTVGSGGGGGGSSWGGTAPKDMKDLVRDFVNSVNDPDKNIIARLQQGAVIADVPGAVENIAQGGFDFIQWIRDNWQLAVLGAVALLVLLRR